MSCAHAGAASAAPSSRAAARRRRGCGFRIRSAPGRAPGPRAARGCAACAALSIWFKTSPFYGHRRRLPPTGFPPVAPADALLTCSRLLAITVFIGSMAAASRIRPRSSPDGFRKIPASQVPRIYKAMARGAAARRNSRVCSNATEREPLPTDRIPVRLSRANEPERGRCTAAQEPSAARGQRQDTMVIKRLPGNQGTRPAGPGGPTQTSLGAPDGVLTSELSINTVIASNRPLGGSVHTA